MRGKKVVSYYGAADWVIADEFLGFDDSDMTWGMGAAFPNARSHFNFTRHAVFVTARRAGPTSIGSRRKRKRTTVELVGGPFAGRVATIQSCDNSLRIIIERDES